MNLNKKSHLKALTGLRFFAAIHIVLFHYLLSEPSTSYPSKYLKNFVEHGYSGVSLFFILSGFVLAYNYTNISVNAPGELRRFWISRLARIYPLYLLILIISSPSIISRLIHATSALFPELLSTVILTPLLLQAWTPWTACHWNCPGWALSVEIFLYVLFPFMAAYISQRSTRTIIYLLPVFWLLSLTAPLIYLAWFSSPETWLNSLELNSIGRNFFAYLPIFHLPQFIIGVLTGALFIRHLNRDDQSIPMEATSKLFLSKLDLGIFLFSVYLILLTGTSNIPYILINNGLLAPLFAVGIYTLAAGESRIAKFLSLPYLLFLGEASYAIYIVHYPLNSLMGKILAKVGYIELTSSKFLIFRILLVIGVALLLLVFIERPARRLVVEKFLVPQKN